MECISSELNGVRINGVVLILFYNKIQNPPYSMLRSGIQSQISGTNELESNKMGHIQRDICCPMEIGVY